jgi:hypothetical protein
VCCSIEQAERRKIRAQQRNDKEDFVSQRAEIGKLDSDAYEKVHIHTYIMLASSDGSVQA